MPGCRWQLYTYVPAVLNVTVTDALLLSPMFDGAPCVLSKKTLWAIEPKANVTELPTATVRLFGVNCSEGVA